MPAHAHVHHAPPAVTEEELATARWEDDGGPAIEPRPAPNAADWLRISAELTERIPELAGREDVIVTCEAGTRSGAPAAFFPTLATIEIDSALFTPRHPATVHPARHGDEEHYPSAWGVLVHEAAHAAHSIWTTPDHLRGTALDAAAQILEESRVEHAHLARRPGDRRFLRSAAATLILPDITSSTPTDRWHAASAAGLVLARRDAGILDPDEVEPVQHTATAILGPDLLAALTAIWQAAHRTADHDATAMIEHARAWCTALGTRPTHPAPPTSTSAAAEAGARAGAGELAEAVGKVTGAVAEHEAEQAAGQAAIRTVAAARVKAKAAQAARAREADDLARQVFNPTRRPILPGISDRTRTRVSSPVTGTRPPTAAEKTAAGQLARALRAAAYRERTATTTASATPPGRLNMRGALARDAQRAAGATPTALPWTRTHRRHTPTPPLRVGIAVDISGSMRAATAPIASAAWILAKATALTDPDSRAATIAYHQSLTAITAPGRTPAHVTEFAAESSGHRLAEALDALTAGLDLTTPGTGRLLVIASDGRYTPDEAAHAADRVHTLRRAGCAVLWLAFAPNPRPLPGAIALELADPARAATVIAKAATTAITTTH